MVSPTPRVRACTALAYRAIHQPDTAAAARPAARSVIAAHSHQRPRRGAAVEAREIGGDCRQRVADDLLRNGFRKPETLRESNRADIDAEPFVDLGAAAERELRAATSGVEHDRRSANPTEPRLRPEIGEPTPLRSRADLARAAATTARSLA